jgi:hypothetical protein
VQRPEVVARAIARSVGRARTEIWTSFPTRVAAGAITAFPWLLDWVVAFSRRGTPRAAERAPGN